MSSPLFGRVSPRGCEFIASVLALSPRLTAFDCDGTLWDADAGEEFFYWELERGLVGPEVERWARPRYEQYRRGEVSEEQMCGEMVTMHAGLDSAGIQRAAGEFFRTRIAARIFPEMQELTRRLAADGCELWAVSSTNDWVIRAAMEYFAITEQHVLAASVEIKDGRATDRLVRVPTDEDKARLVREVIRRTPDAAFGNSIHDVQMLAIAKCAFAVNPSAELEKFAQQHGWRIHRPGNAPTDQH